MAGRSSRDGGPRKTPTFSSPEQQASQPSNREITAHRGEVGRDRELSPASPDTVGRWRSGYRDSADMTPLKCSAIAVDSRGVGHATVDTRSSCAGGGESGVERSCRLVEKIAAIREEEVRHRVVEVVHPMQEPTSLEGTVGIAPSLDIPGEKLLK